jgi:signal transduction histidine kinase
LVINGMQAMATADQPRNLTVRTARAEGEGLKVAVEDTGIGIAAETVGQVFDAFYTTKPDGMGMGLAIARSIIEAHRGMISATPKATGGMTFQFTIPPAAD